MYLTTPLRGFPWNIVTRGSKNLEWDPKHSVEKFDDMSHVYWFKHSTGIGHG